MLSKSKFLLPVLAGALLFQSCGNKNNDEFYTTADGLNYKIYEQNDKGEYENRGKIDANDTTGARLDQVMTVHMSYRTESDSVLFDSREQNQPIMIPVMEPSFRGSLEDALTMMRAGDSGVFKINADSLFTKTFGQPMPPFIKPGSFLTFFLKADKIQSRDEAIADQQRMFEEQQKVSLERAAGQMKEDDAKIQEYIKANNLKNVQKTDAGVYYVITQPGKGPNAKAGDNVAVHYKLSFLDGKQLESSYDNPMSGGQPFTFPLGQGQVIQGWDNGIAQLNKGSKAILLIPSPLAYGDQARGEQMPANSILRFDVELVDINK
jgi:FKBP-type peptidyl-prolyl cis-trans isomerase FkpA